MGNICEGGEVYSSDKSAVVIECSEYLNFIRVSS